MKTASSRPKVERFPSLPRHSKTLKLTLNELETASITRVVGPKECILRANENLSLEQGMPQFCCDSVAQDETCVRSKDTIMDRRKIQNRNKRIRKKIAKLHRAKEDDNCLMQHRAEEGESSVLEIATSSPRCSENRTDSVSHLHGMYQVGSTSLSASYVSSHIRFCQDDAFSGALVSTIGMNRSKIQQAESVIRGQDTSKVCESILVAEEKLAEERLVSVTSAEEAASCPTAKAVVLERQIEEEIPLDYGVVSSNGVSNKVFVHGNYHRYYGYRLGKAFEQDPRLGLMERQWFHKKRCLDIGCNEGIVTLSIAKSFGTKSMTGIDLDEHLIKRACSHLKGARSEAIDTFVLSQKSGVDAKSRRDAKRTMQSLAQTWFVHGNFLAGRVDKGSFDCITAFSVTKWVHLHGGDSGIRYFFKKISDLLSPGGKFILEPQSWKSYKSAAAKMRRSVGEKSQIPEYTYFFRLQDLQIRPEDFCTILPLEFGLKFIRRLDPPSQTAEGFDRQMYMFQKC